MTSRWFAYIRPRPSARMRLFCLHYSGGDASAFAAWQDGFPELIEVWPVQLPGRGSRLAEPLRTDLAALAEELAEALRPRLDCSWAVFGHSLGALLGFELVRRLRENGSPLPSRLFVSAHEAPQSARNRGMHLLDDDGLAARLRSLNGTPEAVLANGELRDLFLPILRADFTLCETYAYRPASPLSCPLSAFGGLEDRYVGRTDLEAWREHAGGGFRVRMFPGDHFYLNASRPLLLRAIAQELCGEPENTRRQ